MYDKQRSEEAFESLDQAPVATSSVRGTNWGEDISFHLKHAFHDEILYRLGIVAEKREGKWLRPRL